MCFWLVPFTATPWRFHCFWCSFKVPADLRFLHCFSCFLIASLHKNFSISASKATVPRAQACFGDSTTVLCLCSLSVLFISFQKILGMLSQLLSWACFWEARAEHDHALPVLFTVWTFSHFLPNFRVCARPEKRFLSSDLGQYERAFWLEFSSLL